MLLLAAAAAPAQTSIYRSVDRDGNVTFSDVPSPNSERIVVPPVQTFDSKPPAGVLEGGGEGSGRAEAGGAPYTSFSIVSPADDQSVRSNGGDVTVGIRLEPALRKLDRIEIFIDGRSVGRPSRDTALTVSSVDRGTHRLHAVVVDQAGKVVARTGIVRFHLLRASAR